MDRRKFLKNLTYAGSTGMLISGLPVKTWAVPSSLKAAINASENDKVVVFIQLHGGNDALNTLIPVNQYNEYYNYRPNIAIPSDGNRKFINLDSSLANEDQVGLHPDIEAFKKMYEQGQAAIVQNVGYEHMNLSHFRGRDIMFMGGDASDNLASGWMGRFLNEEYPGYPDAYPTPSMPDPIAIEIGNAMSLAFHRTNGIPIGFNVQSPQAFYNLITNVGVEPPIKFPESHAGDELRYLMEFEKKSNQYAERLKNVYEAGKNSSVVYPTTYPLNAPEASLNNPLSGQLKLIARLLAGGVKTRVFLCRIGGFDTHGEQVENYDSTIGTHAALIYHLFSAVNAFYDDLAQLGLAEKVLSLTFTEFGRRVYSNASYGTDHGTATPVFLFGSGLNPGVYGSNPDLDDLKGGNIKYAIDYRQIYTSIVNDWFEATPKGLEAAGFEDWIDSRIPLFAESVGIDNSNEIKNDFVNIYPNPVQSKLQLRFHASKQLQIHQVNILNTEGKVIMNIMGNLIVHSFQTISMDVAGLSSGTYIVQIIAEGNRLVNKKIIKK
jgi:uncharacterized protein (DUF1501 family)